MRKIYLGLTFLGIGTEKEKKRHIFDRFPSASFPAFLVGWFIRPLHAVVRRSTRSLILTALPLPTVLPLLLHLLLLR